MPRSAATMTTEPASGALDWGTLSASQHDFLHSTKPYVAVFAGYGFGKSYIERLAALKMAFENQGLPIGIGSMDFPRLMRDVVDPLLVQLDDSGIGHRHYVKDRIIALDDRWGGAQFHLISVEVPKQIKGANLAGFVGDEFAMWRPDIPGLPGTTWDVIRSRVRVKGGTCQIKLGTTPEGWNNWATETFIHGPDDPKERLEWEPDYQVIYGSSFDNEENLQAGFLQRLMRGMTKGQVQEKIYGRPAADTGRFAYYEYDRTRHCKPTSYHWSRGPLCVFIDWNVSPMCAGLGQYHRDRFYVFGEIVIEDNADTKQMARKIRQRAKELGVPNDEIVAFPDASGGHRDTRSSTTDIAILKKAGIRVRVGRRNPNERGRIACVNAVLEQDELQHAPGLPWFSRDLSKVEKNPDGSICKPNGTKLTHISDGFGYWVCQERPIVGKGGMVTPSDLR